MAGNSFGTLFRLTTFGESHGISIGGVIDGMPSGIIVESEFIQYELDRRRPGQSAITSPRKESDTIQILSGLFEGRTLGTPIGFIIPNEDQHSADYDDLKDVYRPGHADEAWDKKFGIRDYRGGGRHSDTAQAMIALIEQARDAGDSVGGTIVCVCKGLTAGWGEPVFDKLHAVLAHAMLSINASQGFELLGGFECTRSFGSENNHRSGGVSGGISTGEDLVFRVAFKPVSTIRKPQQTKNTAGEEVTLEAAGRHDPCVLPRAVPIVEAMAALVMADMHLLHRR
jgi:chorismate synthase